jgi:hypothetical protein
MITKGKMTPGPWKVDEEIDFVDGCIAIVDAGSVIAHVEYWPHEEDDELMEQGKANAQAIAAVPDMIEALQHIMAMHDDAYLIGHPEWHEIVKESGAALEKAGIKP